MKQKKVEMGFDKVELFYTKTKSFVKTNFCELIYIVILILFSFYKDIFLLIFLLMLLMFLKQKEIGAIKIINLITLRSVINPGIAVDIAIYQGLKWIILFFCSFYLIMGYKKIKFKFKKRTYLIVLSVLLFSVYSMITSLLFSTLPTIAIFKVLSYVVIFLGVIIGVANTIDKYNWIIWLYRMFFMLFMCSIPLILFPVGYFRNGVGFQGFINHPNLFGVVATLFFCLNLIKLQQHKFSNKFIGYLLNGLLFYMIILSQSRTSFISTSALFCIYIIFSNINIIKKIINICFGGVVVSLFTLSNENLRYSIQEFLFKGNENLFYSRENQIGGLMSNFSRNPWFGSGFAVPVTPYRSFSFSAEYIVEPGNLILAVLSYGGIIGLLLFLNYLVIIIISNKKNMKILILLPISTVLISMGEMVFFSSNNIGIWLYMFIAIYIFKENDNEKASNNQIK